MPHRPLATALALALALAACDAFPIQVKRTPREFYAQRDPGLVERREGEDEIRVRVRSFAEGLGRGDAVYAATALGPAEQVEVIGVDGNRGLPRRGPTGLVAALSQVRGPVPAVARTPDLRVEVSSGGLVGWFSTHVELLPTDQPLQNAVQMRASGVFGRDRGEWRLLQIQLSRPYEPPPPAPADTATPPAAGASRTSDEAPGEGG